MGDLSNHFSRWELACPCCGVAQLSEHLVDGLEDLRAILKRPIRVTSGYRCNLKNIAVGGVSNSYHCMGLAADIVVEGLDPLEIAEAAEQVVNFAHGGIGIYPAVKHASSGKHGTGFVHVDTRSHRARWGRIDGAYCDYDEARQHVLDQRAAGVYLRASDR